MKSVDYAEGETFQVERHTVFSAESLPLCAAGQVAGPGDFVSVTVGGWGVVAARGKDDRVRVLRNACRHQNMQVVAARAGNCESFRCRFHGWTYDLDGKFLGAPPPVAPKDPQSPDLHLAVLASSVVSGLVFFSFSGKIATADLGPLPAYGGTLTTEISCNWKVCVEHLLADRRPSADFTWLWPLLAVRRAGPVMLIEQVVPHTFLRTRLFTHVFGRAADDGRQAAATIKHVCENLQADRAAGEPAIDGPLVRDFHRQLAEAYARGGIET